LKADELREKPDGKFLHFDGDGVYLLAEKTVERQGGDSNGESGDRGDQCFADAVREDGGVAESRLGNSVEHGHHAEDGAQESDERADPRDNFEQKQTAFKFFDFFASVGMKEFDHLCVVEVSRVYEDFDDTGERARVVSAHVKRGFDGLFTLVESQKIDDDFGNVPTSS
jgi:hypothetical protein